MFVVSFLKCVISGLFAQKFSHLFYLRTIVLHVFQIILFHGLILHFFFIEHCLVLASGANSTA